VKHNQSCQPQVLLPRPTNFISSPITVYYNVFAERTSGDSLTLWQKIQGFCSALSYNKGYSKRVITSVQLQRNSAQDTVTLQITIVFESSVIKPTTSVSKQKHWEKCLSQATVAKPVKWPDGK